jgi:hypothetical protein
MSLYDQLKKNIETSIQEYVERVSKKYQIDEKELIDLFNNQSSTTLPKKETVKKVSKIDSVDVNDLSVERLNKCTKPELSALCKSKNLKCTGTKDVLLQRLLGKEESVPSAKSKSKNENKNETKTTKSKTEKRPTIIENLLAKKETKLARKNEFGNYFYPGTKIVLNDKSVAFGTQEDDGTVADLTPDDIEECKKFKILYKIPNNLDKKTDLENVKVEELEDENVEADDDVIEEEEEQQEEEEIEEIEDDE